MHTKSQGLGPELLHEDFCMKAVTRVDLLVLPETDFHLIDSDSAHIITASYISRKIWREQRNVAVNHEKKVFRDLKKRIAKNSKNSENPENGSFFLENSSNHNSNPDSNDNDRETLAPKSRGESRNLSRMGGSGSSSRLHPLEGKGLGIGL
jgi:hypothetical protein